jgi:cobalt-zinc-cadmium efflux system protein
MAHSHEHEEMGNGIGSRLVFTLILNLILPLAQVVGGIFAHSMALVSDAVHNFSDFAAVLIAYIAYRIGKKGASPQNTFGYKRAEIIAAAVNVVILLAASAFIVYEAVERLRNPEAVLGKVVVLMALLGILGNGLSAWLLHRDAKHSVNIRGAFLHMVGDLLTSVMVLVSGVVILFRPWYWLDPLLSLVIVLFVLKNCWAILRESTGILMNATPEGMNLETIKEAMEKIPGVLGVHYLHAWRISSSSTAFSCHVEVCDQPVSGTESLSETIRHELHDRFGIDHPILQFETRECGKGGMLCEISCGGSDPA